MQAVKYIYLQWVGVCMVHNTGGTACRSLPPAPAPLPLPRTEGDVSYTICVSLNCYWVDVYRVHDAWGTACLQNYPRLPHSTEWDVSYYIYMPKVSLGWRLQGE